jgi:site-specific recombinase XerD
MLRERGQLPVRKYKPTAIDIVVDGFRVHLAENCGLAERTIEKRAYYVGLFLKETFAAGRFLPSRIRRHHLHAYVANFAKTRQPESANAVAICLRSFLRYLQFRGQVEPSLVAAVPTIRKWKLDRVPRAMDDEQLNSFLSQFDRSSASGRRDYAIALCLSELGLRASEVAAMRMDDVDWERATLRIPAGKSRRERVLPLTHRVGKALAIYIRYGRLKTSAQTVFVRHSSPRGTVLNTEQVRGAMRRVYPRVPGCEHWTGTHVLRHTAATRLHRRGVSLKNLADILGHCSLDTTAIYTKIDLTSLSAVALPWPEVRS